MIMRFIVVTQEWMSAHGLMPLPTMRKSKDGSKIILHEDYFNLISKKDEKGLLELDGAAVYAHNSAELGTLLQSDEWSYNEDEPQTHSADYVQVAAAMNLMAATKAGIQSMSLSAEEALEMKEVYPDWTEGIEVKTGERYNSDGDLWEVVQGHTTQANWKPSLNTLQPMEEGAGGALGHSGRPDTVRARDEHLDGEVLLAVWRDVQGHTGCRGRGV